MQRSSEEATKALRREVRCEDGRVHWSQLRQMAKSPAHYKYACEHPTTPTRAMLVGCVADRLVFGGQDVAVYEGQVRRGRDWDLFRRENPGAVCCNAGEYEDAKGAADSVLADPVAAPILTGAGAAAQPVLRWEAYGFPCAAGIEGQRGGLDVLNAQQGYVADLKIVSPSVIEPASLQRHCLRQWWHGQARWYLEACHSTGVDVNRFYLVCVESAPPHCVVVLGMTDAVLDLAHKSITLWTERLKMCEDAGEWPGPAQSIVDLEPWSSPYQEEADDG